MPVCALFSIGERQIAIVEALDHGRADGVEVLQQLAADLVSGDGVILDVTISLGYSFQGIGVEKNKDQDTEQGDHQHPDEFAADSGIKTYLNEPVEKVSHETHRTRRTRWCWGEC